MNSSTLSMEPTLRQLTAYYSMYVHPVVLFLTIVTNTLNICVLSRRTIRMSSCAHYFFAFSIGSLLYTSIRCIPDFISARFGLDSQATPLGCKLRSYFANALLLHTAIMLVLASVNRFCASSPWAYFRNFTQVYIAQWVIIGCSVGVAVFISPYLTMYNYNYNTSICILASTISLSIYRSSRNILNFLLAPLAMLVFGLLTIGNIQNQQRRVAPAAPLQVQPRKSRRTEGQLARMLILQVGAYFVFSAPLAIVNLLFTFNTASNSSAFVSEIRDITIIWQLGIYFLSFFLYILVGRVYREEMIRILKLTRCACRPLQGFIPTGVIRRPGNTMQASLH